MKFDRSNKFDLCYYGQVNSLRLKSSVASKWQVNTFGGNIYFAGNITSHLWIFFSVSRAITNFVYILTGVPKLFSLLSFNLFVRLVSLFSMRAFWLEGWHSWSTVRVLPVPCLLGHLVLLVVENKIKK